MFALGLAGSPRKKGNSAFLLNAFLEELRDKGAVTHRIEVAGKTINPCQGCVFCEKNGYCRQEEDDMIREIYPLLRRADIVVAATPMYFYGATAQLKALIDRSQALWSRRYKLGLIDPQSRSRKGVMLCVGATKGKNLFTGIHLTAKYFFDALSADFVGEMGYRRMENPGDLKMHSNLMAEVKAEAAKLDSLFSRQKVLFLCRENACRSKMATAFARHLAGDRVEALSAGSEPAAVINPVMVEAMAEKGLDMFLRTPRSIETALAEMKPDKIITMGCAENCPYVPGAEITDWGISDPANQTLDVMREVRDEIEARVRKELQVPETE